MTRDVLVLLGVAVGALALCVAVLRVTLPLLRRRGVLDVPGARSLHEVPTVRGGGLGILTALVLVPLLALAVLPPGRVGPAGVVVVLVVPVAALGLLGLADDLLTVGVGTRMGLQVVVGVAAGWLLARSADASPAWVPLVAVVVLVLVNATNFMDGANGLVSTHAVVTGLWYTALAVGAGVHGAAVVAAAVTGAALGFLPTNVPVARAFLGDVGSYTLGAAWAVVGSLLVMEGASLVAVVAPLVVLLADTGSTLLRRAVAGDRVTSPHRLHVYQRLTRGGWSHLRVTGAVAAATVVLCALALPSVVGAPAVLRLGGVGAGVLLSAGYLALTAVVGGSARWQASREPA